MHRNILDQQLDFADKYFKQNDKKILIDGEFGSGKSFLLEEIILNKKLFYYKIPVDTTHVSTFLLDDDFGKNIYNKTIYNEQFLDFQKKIEVFDEKNIPTYPSIDQLQRRDEFIRTLDLSMYVFYMMKEDYEQNDSSTISRQFIEENSYLENVIECEQYILLSNSTYATYINGNINFDCMFDANIKSQNRKVPLKIDSWRAKLSNSIYIHLIDEYLVAKKINVNNYFLIFWFMLFTVFVTSIVKNVSDLFVTKTNVSFFSKNFNFTACIFIVIIVYFVLHLIFSNKIKIIIYYWFSRINSLPDSSFIKSIIEYINDNSSNEILYFEDLDRLNNDDFETVCQFINQLTECDILLTLKLDKMKSNQICILKKLELKTLNYELVENYDLLFSDVKIESEKILINSFLEFIASDDSPYSIDNAVRYYKDFTSNFGVNQFNNNVDIFLYTYFQYYNNSFDKVQVKIKVSEFIENFKKSIFYDSKMSIFMNEELYRGYEVINVKTWLMYKPYFMDCKVTNTIDGINDLFESKLINPKQLPDKQGNYLNPEILSKLKIELTHVFYSINSELISHNIDQYEYIASDRLKEVADFIIELAQLDGYLGKKLITTKDNIKAYINIDQKYYIEENVKTIEDAQTYMNEYEETLIEKSKYIFTDGSYEPHKEAQHAYSIVCVEGEIHKIFKYKVQVGFLYLNSFSNEYNSQAIEIQLSEDNTPLECKLLKLVDILNYKQKMSIPNEVEKFYYYDFLINYIIKNIDKDVDSISDNSVKKILGTLKEAYPYGSNTNSFPFVKNNDISQY